MLLPVMSEECFICQSHALHLSGILNVATAGFRPQFYRLPHSGQSVKRGKNFISEARRFCLPDNQIVLDCPSELGDGTGMIRAKSLT